MQYKGQKTLLWWASDPFRACGHEGLSQLLSSAPWVTQVSMADFVHQNKQWVRPLGHNLPTPDLHSHCNVYNNNIRRNSGFQRASDILFGFFVFCFFLIGSNVLPRRNKEKCDFPPPPRDYSTQSSCVILSYGCSCLELVVSLGRFPLLVAVYVCV